jgi:hypothetical protein
MRRPITQIEFRTGVSQDGTRKSPARKALAGTHPATRRALQNFNVPFTGEGQIRDFADGDIHAWAHSGMRVGRSAAPMHGLIWIGGCSNDDNRRWQFACQQTQYPGGGSLKMEAGIAHPRPRVDQGFATNDSSIKLHRGNATSAPYGLEGSRWGACDDRHTEGAKRGGRCGFSPGAEDNRRSQRGADHLGESHRRMNIHDTGEVMAGQQGRA